MSSTVAESTRIARVRDILDRAAAGSTADYGGRGPFWHLPLPALLRVEVHGVRMIAPLDAKPAGGSCCCSHGGAIGTADAARATDLAGSDVGAGGVAKPHSGEARRQPGRGAASGLVRGLRGQPPFDGSQFPRLPWGGRAVPPEEIAEIEAWIDDGCPDDREVASFELGTLTAAPALETIPAGNVEAAVRSATDTLALAAPHSAAPYAAGSRIYTVHGGSAEALQSGAYGVKQRMNLDCLSPAQVEKLRYAFRELYRLNKWPADRRSYNNLALIHQNHCQHGWERFLPWHRVYLYEFELALQDHCPGVTMPYWDWTMPQYRPNQPEKGWIIPPAFQAYLTEAALDGLGTAEPPVPASALAQLRDAIVDTGKRYVRLSELFLEVADLIGADYVKGEHRNRFIDALLASNPLWYPLRYPAQYCGQTINQRIRYHYPTARDMAQIHNLRTFRDFGGGSLYNDSFGFLDQNPHNTMHIWTGGMNPLKCPGAPDFESDLKGDRNNARGVQVAGRRFHSRDDLYSQPQFGDMFSNLTASYDPVFWPIHANVDRTWWEWQQAHPQALPADLDAVLTPWGYTIADTLDMARFGYEYVKSAYVLPVGLAAPVGRFVSAPIDIPETVRAGFQQAEIRLHRVPQLPRSCFVRAFLNLPDADASTPIEGDNYAGYLAIFGHGECYGGPGHCDLPPLQARPYDHRGRSHNTPRNHRIDVTETARHLLEQGATSLAITLVVIGADYQEDRELLRLEGVSLDFLD